MVLVFSPLKEELQLLPGSLSPYLSEAIVRLGTWMPFERAPAAVSFFTRASVSIESARRLTEEAGAALVATEAVAVEQVERELPDAPEGPPVQQLSADGAMVPLLKGGGPRSKGSLWKPSAADDTRGRDAGPRRRSRIELGQDIVGVCRQFGATVTN